MRVLVCGSRDFADRDLLYRTLDHIGIHLVNHRFDALIEGEAPGADTLAREWAESYEIPVLKFPADWRKYGRAAGPIRNKQMLEEGKPDLVVAFPRGKLDDTKGTKNMVKQARDAGIKTIVIEE